MDRLPAFQKHLYESAFRIADAGYLNGRVAKTAEGRKTHWRNWVAFVTPLGMDPELQGINHAWRVRCLTGFAGLSRTGYFGRGKQVQSSTVSGAITAIGKTIALAQGINPTKCPNSEKFLPRLQEMFEGWHKEDPPTMKKLPVEADIPEQLVEVGMAKGVTEKERAVGDCALNPNWGVHNREGVVNHERGAIKGGADRTIQALLRDILCQQQGTALSDIPRGAGL